MVKINGVEIREVKATLSEERRHAIGQRVVAVAERLRDFRPRSYDPVKPRHTSLKNIKKG